MKTSRNDQVLHFVVLSINEPSLTLRIHLLLTLIDLQVGIGSEYIFIIEMTLIWVPLIPLALPALPSSQPHVRYTHPCPLQASSRTVCLSFFFNFRRVEDFSTRGAPTLYFLQAVQYFWLYIPRVFWLKQNDDFEWDSVNWTRRFNKWATNDWQSWMGKTPCYGDGCQKLSSISQPWNSS